MQSMQRLKTAVSCASPRSRCGLTPCPASSYPANRAPLPATRHTWAPPGQSLVLHMQPACWQQAGRCRATRLLAAAAAGPGNRTSQAPDSVTRLYDALNARDVAAAAACLAADVAYESLALLDSLTGQHAVSKFYADSLAVVPREAAFELEQATGTAGSTVTVVWRLVLASNQALLSRGIALYTLEPGSGLISSVTECHEHPVKLSHSQLLLGLAAGC
ncbi:hypothetical protein COO60DRAFT_541665 [Scenedesmus sp. NREL 46B-D3]|nr:hypothetical protein COO60DRAFT_541665 [Scenedesmus sp. NREL 46B-D3]